MSETSVPFSSVDEVLEDLRRGRIVVILDDEGRLLLEHNTETQRWDAAPSIVLIPIEGFEVQAGYRFGDLRDPDFAVRGGEGWFAVFSARLTENVFPTSADFWRHRF